MTNRKRIAVVFEDVLHIQLGVFNAALNRAKHLAAVADYDIDVYMIYVYDGWLMRRLRGSHHVTDRPERVTVEGVELRLMWFKRDWRDSLRHRLLHREPTHFIHFLEQCARQLEGYDLVTAHDRMGGEVAEEAGRLFGIPWYVTWHGGNSVTTQLDDPVLRRITARLMEGATCNFMVSRGLVDIMREFTPRFKADVMLNGANDTFFRRSDDERAALRKRFEVPEGMPVVAFVGRFEPVKNVLMLPEIFDTLQRKLGRKVLFWAIGTGVQHADTVRLMAERTDVECRFWGQATYDQMPLMMNCIDVLVLPSQKEGFGLVAVEALQCGAHVVGSDAQGLPEVIGPDNAFPLDDELVEHVSRRAVEMLCGHVTQATPPGMSWPATARREWEIYRAELTARHS